MSLTRIAIVNITGYIGAEVARLLFRHPRVKIVSVTGRSEAGKRLGSVLPHLAPLDLMIEQAPAEADLVFSALPHTAHPMSVLSSAVSALSTYYEGSSDPSNPEDVELTMRLG